MDWQSGTPMTDLLFAAATAFAAQSLHGKTAVVTGSSRGIGAGIARRLAALGARVVINYSKDEAGANAVVQAINADRPTDPPAAAAAHAVPIADDASDAEMADAEPIRNPSQPKSTPSGEAPTSVRAIAVRADVSTIAGGQALVAACMRAYGRLDILILNAGINSSCTLAETEEDEFDAQFAVHVKGPLFLAKACAEVMHDGKYCSFLLLHCYISAFVPLSFFRFSIALCHTPRSTPSLPHSSSSPPSSPPLLLANCPHRRPYYLPLAHGHQKINHPTLVHPHLLHTRCHRATLANTLQGAHRAGYHG